MSIAAQIESVQPDVYAKVCSESWFAPISIFKLREKRLDSEVNKSLSGLGALSITAGSRPGTKVGATVEVLMPTLKSALGSDTGPVCQLEQKFIVKEQPTINLGANGTGLTCEQIAVEIAQLFHGYSLGGALQALMVSGGGTFYRYIDAGPEAPFLMLEVTLWATVALLALTRTIRPAVALSGDVVTLTDQQPGGGSNLYYTVDGSFPGPGNSTAAKYTSPFNLGSGVTVRVAAYNTAQQTGSMVYQFTTP